MDNEDIFEQEISNIENLFVNGVAFQNINDIKINSKLDFFVIYHNDAIFTNADDYFEQNLKEEITYLDLFYMYQKWYVLIKMLFLFLNTDTEVRYLQSLPTDEKLEIQQLQLIGINSKRYKYFDAWIFNNNNDVLRINNFIQWFVKCDLTNKKFVAESFHLHGFSDIEKK